LETSLTQGILSRICAADHDGVGEKVRGIAPLAKNPLPDPLPDPLLEYMERGIRHGLAFGDLVT
jgi:hypothetical protein